MSFPPDSKTSPGTTHSDGARLSKSKFLSGLQCFKRTQDGDIRHEEYLCWDPIDPRLTFAQTLLESVGSEGSICVYSPYQRAILEGLAAAFPQYESALRLVIGRLWDLLPVIRLLMARTISLG